MATIKNPENALMVTMLEKSGSLTSLSDLIRVKDNENVALLLDISGSMDLPVDDSLSHNRNYTRRIEALRRTVAEVMQTRVVPKIVFGGPIRNDDQLNVFAWMVEDIPEPTGSTPLKEGIEFAKQQGFGRLLLISDGGPDNPSGALEAARQFGGRIDVIFVGPAGSGGSEFMDEIAAVSGGSKFEGDLGDTKQLAGTVIGLLEGNVEPDEEDEDDFDEDEDDEDEEEDEDDE